MPQNEPNQASSKPYVDGLHIPESEVPTRKDRRLFDMGAYQEGRIIKRAEDVLDYTLDLKKWLEPTAVIKAARAWAEPGELLVSALEFSDTAVVLWLAGGADDIRHEAVIRITTNLGQQKVFRFAVTTNGTPPEFVFVSVESPGASIGQAVPIPVDPVGPNPVASPVSIAFPNTAVGAQSQVYTVTVTNAGDQPLELRSISTTTNFAFTANPELHINPGESFQVFVTFAPISGGSKAGSLLIDFGTGNVLLTSMTGTAAAAQAVASWAPTSRSFGSVSVGAASSASIITLSNTGTAVMTISALVATGNFEIVSAVPASLAAGQSVGISVRFVPATAGAKSGSLILTSNATGPNSVALSGNGISTTQAISSMAPTSMAFGNETVGAESSAQVVTLTNTGNRPMAITSITASGQFAQSNNCGSSLAAGASCSINVKFAPTTEGAKSGTLSLVSDADSGNSSVSLTGNGTPAITVLPRLSTSGNQFVTPSNEPVRLMSVNWFGAEGTNYTPHGTWIRPWRDIIDQIDDFGFNCIRIAFSGDFCAPGRTVPLTAIDEELNADLVGLTALEILDLYIDYCTTKGIYIVLDHHRRNAGAGADGSPVGSGYTVTNWIDNWLVLANRYKDNPTVVGADIHNEPHDLTWNAWATYSEQCGNAIHAVAPDWIIFVEGVGNYNDVPYWWGGQLQGVADRPVALNIPNRLSYSPHEYGQSVGNQQWLAYDGQTPPANWPNNLWAIWSSVWGFIFENNIAPIWVGEFGGHFGVDGNGNLTKPHGAYETQWCSNLVKYLNGDYDGNGSSNLPGGKLGMSFAYWSYNPNSGDTGGLVRDDWETPQTVKLDIIEPLLNFNPAPPAPQFRGMLWQTLNTNVDYRRSWDSLGITKTMFQWVAVDGSSFIPQSILPLHTGQLNLTEIAAQPWASEIVIGLPGIFNEVTARASAADLADLAQQFGALTYPSNAIGFYFPIEIDPTWTAAPTVLGPLWAQLPRPLYVSCYYGIGTTTPAETIAAANWLASFIPSDVTLLFQDGVGAHEVSIAEANRRYQELRSVFGSRKVELIAEAFRVNPDYAGVEGTYFVRATAAQLNQQLTAYSQYPIWLFDGPNYLTEQLISDVTGQPLVVVPSNLAANANGSDVVFTWAADPSAHFNVINYDVATGAVISNTVVTTNSYTFTGAAQVAQYGFTVTFVHFAVRKVSPSGSIITSFADFSGNVT